MKRRKKFEFGLVIAISAIIYMAGALGDRCFALPTFSTIHGFIGGTNDGRFPSGSLTLSNSTFYGVTGDGGANRAGTIFKMNMDGSGFQILHNFGGSTNNGDNPYDSLTLSGSTLYGVTRKGGAKNAGTVFKMNTDGADFQVLHSFEGTTSDGGNPYGSLTLLGSTLYGMSFGGDPGGGWGAIFKINTDGSSFQVLHSFTGGTGDEPYPSMSLTLSDTTLYGMTTTGGKDNAGTIFKINIDGTGFELLHNFGNANDACGPLGSLTLSGSTLYGTTGYGSAAGSGYGTVFRINTDGSGYRILHSFSFKDGAYAKASLTLSGSTLYGVTNMGGAGSGGTVFQINTDGSDFQVLHDFGNNRYDGTTPGGALTLSGSMLYGVATTGGEDNNGTIFSLALQPATTVSSSNTVSPVIGVPAGTTVPSTTVPSTNVPAQGPYSILHNFTGSDGKRPIGSPTLAGSTLYGVARSGGDSDNGTVFKINTDGVGFQVLYSFSGWMDDEVYPHGCLTLSGSTLYGTTLGNIDGKDKRGKGTVFKINTDGTGFRILHRFTGGDGKGPHGSLALSGSTLYGMTVSGGRQDSGTIFQINTDGNDFKVLYSFADNGAKLPYGSLTLSGSSLYGMTEVGGRDNGSGAVFKINTDGTGFQVLHSFTGSDGEFPHGSLILSGSTLRGMTSSGGNGLGVVFQVNTDGTGFKVLHSFTKSTTDGAKPFGDLNLSGSILYGMTAAGGDNGAGTVFKINTDGTGFQILHSFVRNTTDGVMPGYNSLTLSGSTLYGMTSMGGASGYGTIFSMNKSQIVQ